MFCSLSCVPTALIDTRMSVSRRSSKDNFRYMVRKLYVCIDNEIFIFSYHMDENLDENWLQIN